MTTRRFLTPSASTRAGAFWPIIFGGMAGFFFGYLFLSTRPFVYISGTQASEGLSPSCDTPAAIQDKKTSDIGIKRKSALNIDQAIGDLHKEKRRLISTLYNETRLLCWVMTEPKNNDRRAAIMETWGKRCHLTLFMVGAKQMLAVDEQLHTVNPDTYPNVIPTRPSMPPAGRRRIASNAFVVYLTMKQDTYENLWMKTRHAFVYIHKHFRNAYDWVLKVDDDSFVIVENLRLFLRGKKAEDPFYYGCQYSANAPRGYASGGSGYVMSRFNVDKFVGQLERRNASADKECLTQNNDNNGAEDVRLAQCLDKLGIGPGDTRDADGRFRFSPFTPEHVINHDTLPSKYHWFWGFSTHKMADGFECCSDTAISFHYVTPSMMRVMEYLTYYVHPFSSRELWGYSVNDTVATV